MQAFFKNTLFRKFKGTYLIHWFFLGLVFYNVNWHIRNFAANNLNQGRTRYWSDAEGYYMYLPAIAKGSFQDLEVRTTGKWLTKEGHRFTKYTYGVAFLEAPFFILVHLTLKVINPEMATGFTWPYQLMANFIAFFYGILGMFYVFKLLRKKHTLFISLLTLLGLMYGTNYFYYIFKDPGAAHIYAFFCVALLFWKISEYYDSKRNKDLYIISFLIALITLMRPTNIVFVFFFLFWGLSSWTGVKERIGYWIKHIKWLFISPLIFIFLYSIQVYFWYMMTGEFMLYSYSEEGFNWTAPKFVHVLFHFENGFLMYTPLMLVSIIGMLMGYKKIKNHALILMVFLLMTYVFSCWHKWSFGGAFGYRPFLDYMAMFAIPLAYVFKTFFEKNRLLPQLLGMLVVGHLCKVTLTFMKKMPAKLYEAPHYNWDSFIDLMERVWF